MAEETGPAGKSKMENRKAKAVEAPVDNGAKNPGPFDVRAIKELVALMSRHDLSEIDLRDGKVRIRLRRGSQPGDYSPASAPPSVAAAPAQAPVPQPVPPTEESKPAKPLLTIKSPTPGTFYSSSSPDAEVFVRVGSKVTPTTVVCIIEAMKIFNEITADCTGIITEVQVENQQAVEYGQVLFKVDPMG